MNAVQRRLAAILVADVVGYSRLMSLDEAGTLNALNERRKSILTPVVKAHDGRIVKLMGDGVLVQFASAVKAVEAGFDLQERFAASNQALAEEVSIQLRIGIIAARLEALAEPGGLCISGKVFDEVRGKIAATFEDIGEQSLKNLDVPVRAYRNSRNLTEFVSPQRGERTSIAVLPFANMSSDAEQEYFADGISEDLITDLSKIAGLLVIARAQPRCRTQAVRDCAEQQPQSRRRLDISRRPGNA